MTELVQQIFPYVAILGLMVILWRFIGVLDRVIERQQIGTLPSLQPPEPKPVPVPQPVPFPVPPGPVPIPKPTPVPIPVPPGPVPVPAPVPTPIPVPSGPFASAPPWFRWALTEIGFHEVGNNLGIEKYIALAHAGALGDPWCAIFANAALESVGIPGSRSASSQSYRTDANFVQLTGPALGCIVVFWRGTKDSGLGHVGFYRGEDATRIWTLGGNESDMVEIAALAKAASSFGLVGYYWPRSIPLPAISPVVMPPGSPSQVQTPPAGTPDKPSSAGGQTFIGKMSWFGGPEDTGVSPSEGLALVEPSETAKFDGYFLPEQPPGTTGLARRLDPASHYIAMRWDYNQTSRGYLQGISVQVTANGKTLTARPIDWGPNVNTGRICDMSKGLMTALGLKTDDTCQVTVPMPTSVT